MSDSETGSDEPADSPAKSLSELRSVENRVFYESIQSMGGENGCPSNDLLYMLHISTLTSLQEGE